MVQQIKNTIKKCQKTRMTILLIVLLVISFVSVSGLIMCVKSSDNRDDRRGKSSGIREFTTQGEYAISEIRINVSTIDHPTINARDNLLTLGFNPNYPINEYSDFLVRYTDVETGDVVEFHGGNIADYITPLRPDYPLARTDSDEARAHPIAWLLGRVEEYRLRHTGQALVFDRKGNIEVVDANNNTIYSGGYLWGGYTLSVVILDKDAPAPRHNSRDYLFFPNNEEFMQGSRCRRVIVREKSEFRMHGSIELMFGTRCPGSPAPN